MRRNGANQRAFVGVSKYLAWHTVLGPSIRVSLSPSKSIIASCHLPRSQRQRPPSIVGKAPRCLLSLPHLPIPMFLSTSITICILISNKEQGTLPGEPPAMLILDPRPLSTNHCMLDHIVPFNLRCRNTAPVELEMNNLLLPNWTWS